VECDAGIATSFVMLKMTRGIPAPGADWAGFIKKSMISSYLIRMVAFAVQLSNNTRVSIDRALRIGFEPLHSKAVSYEASV
jgi:hypothetical protein